MAADCDRDLLWPINTRKNDEMNLPTMKTPVLPRIGLRRGVPTALALVATLALVSSAQAQTYTWTGASGANADWFTTSGGTFNGTSLNFSSSPLVSSTSTTDLVFSGNTRPSTVLNRDFSARSLTFNTTTDFSISGSPTRKLSIGIGGIDNTVAQKQTIGVNVDWVGGSGTTPINVASGGEIDLTRAQRIFSNILEKTGTGTLTLRNMSGNEDGLFKITAGTVNLSASGGISGNSVELNAGVLNTGTNSLIVNANQNSPAQYFRQTGGVFNNNSGIELATIEMSGGTTNVGGTHPVYFAGKTTISGGTMTYTGPAGDGVQFYDTFASGSYTSFPVVTISGGVQDFGAGFIATGFSQPNPGNTPFVLVEGGTSTGFNVTQGLTNNGGSITFTAVDAGLLPTYNTPGPAQNYGEADLTLTSGTVSISTIGGSTPEIGALVNSTNTSLGAGNTLNLDFNEDLSRDLLITSGTLNWGGNVALNLTNLGAVADFTSWDFFNDGDLGNTGAFTGDLDGISLVATAPYNGLTFSKSGSLWTSTATGGGQQFTFNETTGVLAVVPEPSSIAAAGIGLAMLGWRRLARRRRAAA